MRKEAPKPPTKKLLMATCLTAGTTTGIWAVTAVGHLVFSGIPLNRLPWYIGAGLTGVVAAGWLAARYVGAIHRQKIRALEDELIRARADAASLQMVLDAVQLVDQQAEVNAVRLQKIQQRLDRDLTEADTQDIPRLRSLPGGGGA